MDYTVNINDIKGKVKHSLSIIGKRAVDDNGNRIFEDVTLGSNEESIIEDHITNAVSEVAGANSDLTTSYSSETLHFNTPENKKCDDNIIGTAIESYIVSYCLYSWFVITAPKIANKYQGDMAAQLSALVRMLHEKEAPSSDTDILSTSTETS